MTHYLIDLFHSDGSFASSAINAVRDPDDGQSSVGGNFVVLVPPDVSVQKPTNLGDLLTKKHAGILANHLAFASNILFDDMLDDTGIDKTAGGTVGTFGKRGSNSVIAGGFVQSTATAIGSSPGTAIVLWEVFDYVYDDPATDLLTKTYREQPQTSLSCQVSFNGGTTFAAATSGAVYNIPIPDQGSSFVINFTNSGPDRLWIGGWQLLF